MSELNRAREELRSSNFLKALELFKNLLMNESLEIEEISECCHSIEKLFTYLKRRISFEFLELLSKNWQKCGEFEKAAECFEQAYQETKDLDYLKEVFNCSIQMGLLEESKKVSDVYIRESLRRGYAPRVHSFLEENKDIIKEEDLRLWKLKSLLAMGDIKTLETLINTGEASDWPLDVLESFLQEASFNTRYWHSSQIILNFLITKVNSERELLVGKKQVVKLLIDSWLTLEKNFDLINMTLNIAKERELNILGHELSKILGNHEDMDFFAAKETKETLDLSSLDLGLDLLLGEEKDNQLERNIKFLMRSGLRAEAMKLLNDLKKTNPESPLLDLLKREVGEDEAESNIQNLLREIGKHTTHLGGEEELQSGYQNMERYYEQSYVEEHYEDMVIGLKLLNLPKVALGLLNRVTLENKEYLERININYLKAELLFSLGEFHRTRDLIDDTLGENPLTEDEKISFIYLRAECYYALSDFTNALIDYKFVLKGRKNYRLSKERVKELEKN